MFQVIGHVGSDAEGRSLFDIQFAATGYIKRSVRRDVIQQGTVRDRYAATIHGVGYYGDRTTRTAIDKDLLKVWLHMLDRCYNPDCKEFPYYGLKGVTVCKRWHNFANFHADCRNIPNWINKRDNPKKYALDKDFYSARCYSPTTCVWLPHTDNRLYAHAKAIRVEYPDGEVAVVLSAADAAAASMLNKSRVLTCIERGESFRGFKFSWAESTYRKPLPNNQIAWVLDELKRNPMSRRLVVSAWAPGNAQTSKLPPCHSIFMMNVQNEEESLDSRLARAMATLKADPQAIPEKIRNKIVEWHKDTPEGRRLLSAALTQGGITPKVKQRLCLHLTQRSCDVALGVPYNIASYALLLHLFSRFSGIEPGIFAHTLVDAHIYTAKPDGSMAEFDHIPGLKEQLGREPRRLPKLLISDAIKGLKDVEALMDPSMTTDEIMRHFVLEGYDPHPTIPFKVAV